MDGDARREIRESSPLPHHTSPMARFPRPNPMIPVARQTDGSGGVRQPKVEKLGLLNAQFQKFAETFQELRQDGISGIPGFDEEVAKLGKIAVGMVNHLSPSSPSGGQQRPIITSPVGTSTRPKVRKPPILSSSSDDSYEIPTLRRSKKKHSRKHTTSPEQHRSARSLKSEGETSALATLVEALSKLDGRKAPKPNKYDVTSGRPLEAFLAEFEEYCVHSFRGSSSLWASELADFLTGPIYEAYNALCCPGESYQVLKHKLQNWFSDYKETIHEKTRKKFEKAQIKPGEPLRLYAARLEKLFTLAYPSKNIKSSRTLRRKFLDTVPRGFRKHVFAVASFMRMQGRELDWSNILPLTSSYDAEHVTDKSSLDSDPEVSEVWAATSASSPNLTVKSAHRDVPGSQRILSSKKYIQDSHGPAYHLGGGDTSNGTSRETVFESRSCHFCKRKGHLKQDCRRYNKQCLACGSSSHMVSNCNQSFRNLSAADNGNRLSRREREDGNIRRVSFESPEHHWSQPGHSHNSGNY